ncbi:hypothetical protein AB6A40_004512 [Gnathostoma spinigerum]|uniref:Uncharacterized protein n=1 Tax=Gnathostoma spinigerum TaxID=75299 RepID=A0ABD6ELF8_9BILA
MNSLRSLLPQSKAGLALAWGFRGRAAKRFPPHPPARVALFGDPSPLWFFSLPTPKRWHSLPTPKISVYPLSHCALNLSSSVAELRPKYFEELMSKKRKFTGSELSLKFLLEKLWKLEEQLQLLREYRHPEYLVAIRKLEADYKEELDFEETAEKLERERIQQQYEQEQIAADKDLEERLSDLMDSMIQECEEQRKHIEHEHSSTDITGTSNSSYPVNKKSLRRRPNEPTPFSEKRMRVKNPQQVIYLLTDSEIEHDLQLLSSLGSSDEATIKSDETTKFCYNLRGENI